MSSDHNLGGPARCYIVFAVPKGHLAHAIVRLRDVTSAVPDAWRFECRYMNTICIFSNIPLKELSVSFPYLLKLSRGLFKPCSETRHLGLPELARELGVYSL